ncbi:trafficking kinesin-binding protein milt isoform X1 [Anthonomus grandis grandis]|uniref:trafficking kinesin-binding protein milt isoform X1 n=2 Tax=Anthonomus grandis grandis TaxID=2921223 RepID=UPI002165F418|nr:trafficking kinesin-binding protein milt isoform X1 [Anthonomus grandis grandis]
MQRGLCGRRVRNGRSVNVRDWEKQGEVLSTWNNELCSGESLPEVEIISLLEEQIPRYKLRADTLTKFGGYENQDWFIPTPALQVDEADLKLSPDQIRETLNYFLLCSNRVSQMTKTYDDIEAVTRLLEEKEKDLELTARIGKELLQHNNKLENTVASLETDLKAAYEKITQLSHECQKKTDLIQILTNDMDDSMLDTASSGRINLDLMQKRIASLQDENKALKSEYCRLASCADDIEAQEQRLLKDLTGQLTCANSSMSYLEDEIDKVKEENRMQHEQILSLQAQLQDTEDKLRKFLAENEELTGLLQITTANQGSLAVELSEFKARFYEVEALLKDAQEQIKKLRKKQTPAARLSLFSSLGATGTGPYDSLQNELEMSMHSELSVDSGISNGTDGTMPQFKKVFETVRCASQNSLSSAESLGSLHSSLGGYVSSMGASGGPRMSVMSTGNYAGYTSAQRRPSSSIYSSSSLGYPSLESTSGHSDMDSLHTTDSEEGYPGAPRKGVPGVPGATELEAALQRLTPGAVLARRANLQTGYGGYESDGFLPFGCRTPDSLMSTGSAGNYFGSGWKLPEKLQIVKPMEGSQTLHHWSQLAQPTFGGLLEERPGVRIRGGKELEDLGLESYGLSDLEEDEEYQTNPGKLFEASVHTYTYTNSTVMHPDDGTFVTPSNRGSRITSVCSSIQNSPPQTPVGLSRRNSCSTFSTTFGLAKMLNERGIKAATPSAFNTPSGPNSFTPTATPYNSPDGGSLSSTRSNTPEPPDEEPDVFSLPQLLLSSMPQFLRDTVGGGARKKPGSQLTAKVNRRRGSGSSSGRQQQEKESLVGKIEKIGINNLMSGQGTLSISGGMYARPSLTSPMTQLTCLLPSHSNDDLTSSISEKTRRPNIDQITSPVTKPKTELGIPGRPGSGALTRRLEQLNARKQRRGGGTGQTRPDLGTVSTSAVRQTTPEPEKSQSTTLGTLSSLLFGRKGGLF